MWKMICRGFAWNKKRDDDDSFQRAEVTGSCLLTSWGRCTMQVEEKKVYFSRLFLPARFQSGYMSHRWFPTQNTVAEHFQEALIAFRRHGLSTWLHCGHGTSVPANRQIQLSSDFTAVIVSIPRTMRMMLASMTLPAAYTVWLWTFWKFVVLKLICPYCKTWSYQLLILMSLPPPLPSHFVWICIWIFNTD